ncbi:MAG: PIN domain-containing protein [Candidatus Nitrosocosmicus sp.]
MTSVITLADLRKMMGSNYSKFIYEDLQIKHKEKVIVDNEAIQSLSSGDLVENSNIRDICKRARIIEPAFSFRDNFEFRQRFSTNEGYSALFTTNSEDHDISEIYQFFNTLTSITKSSFYLIPDTNFIINFGYTNFLSLLRSSNSNYSFLIPNTVIWELESKANSEEKDSISLDRISKLLETIENTESMTIEKLKNLKDFRSLKSSLEKQYSSYAQKRIAQQALSELYRISHDGGSLLRRATAEILPLFTNSSQRDAFIRYEIMNSTIENKFNYILLTSDLVNAFSANVEGLNTLYFDYHLVHYHRSKVADLIYQTVIQYGECKVNLGFDEMVLIGWWKGKVLSDWLNYKLLVYR